MRSPLGNTTTAAISNCERLPPEFAKKSSHHHRFASMMGTMAASSPIHHSQRHKPIPTAILQATIHTQPFRLVGWFAFFFLFPLQLAMTSTKALVNSSKIMTPINMHKAISSVTDVSPLVPILGEHLPFSPTNVPLQSPCLSSVGALPRII